MYGYDFRFIAQRCAALTLFEHYTCRVTNLLTNDDDVYIFVFAYILDVLVLLYVCLYEVHGDCAGASDIFKT